MPGSGVQINLTENRAPGVADWQVSRLVEENRIEVTVVCTDRAACIRLTDELSAMLRGGKA